MGRIEKTVFLSYRRTNVPWALAISQSLTHYGYDVFFDFTGLASGDFEGVILDNIHARAHFLVLLTPSALERCGEPGDWLRHEIEAALDSKRNIVPLMLEGFDFATPSMANQLTGKLASLKKYNAMTVSAEYFEAAMEKLRNKFLNVALDTILQPTSRVATQAAIEAKEATALAPAVAKDELTAQQWAERGFVATDLDEKLRFYTKAIMLKPDYLAALINRGVARTAKGDFRGAILDLDEAVRINALDADAFVNRGFARSAQGDLAGAIEDYTRAINLNFFDADAFCNRGHALSMTGAFDDALADFNEAIRLEPGHAMAFNNRGYLRYLTGDFDGALRDCGEAIRLDPQLSDAFDSRGTIRRDQGDLTGALADYEQAIRLKPSLASAVINRDAVLKAIADRSKH